MVIDHGEDTRPSEGAGAFTPVVRCIITSI